MRQLKNILHSIHGKGVQQLSLICGKVFSKCDINYLFFPLERDSFLIEIKIPLNLLCKIATPNTESLLMLAYSDFLYRIFYSCIKELDENLINKNKGDSYTGRIFTTPPPEVIVSNNYSFINTNTNEWIVRVKTIVPNSNNKINAEKATRLLVNSLPNQIQKFLVSIQKDENIKIIDRVLDLAKEQKFIRQYICMHGYVGFIGNGSKVCNEKTVQGTSALVPFESPKEYEIEIQYNNKTIRGMGIPKGFTCITGGSYSGKTTFLNALALGIYNYPLGSGKEYIISDTKTVTVSMEEKRVINSTDMRLLYTRLPNNENPCDYSDNCASSCVSQAANTIEALTWGAHLILIDEDRSAANFMWRDNTISTLIGTDVFTPFNIILPYIIKKFNISCILITGSNSLFLEMADHSFIFEAFRIRALKAHQFNKKIKYDVSGKVMPELKKENSLFDETGQLLFDYKLNENTIFCDINEIKVGDSTISIGCWDTVLTQNQVNTLVEFVKWISYSNHSTPTTFDSLVNKFVYEYPHNICLEFKGNCFNELPYTFDFLRLLKRMKFLKKYIK